MLAGDSILKFSVAEIGKSINTAKFEFSKIENHLNTKHTHRSVASPLREDVVDIERVAIHNESEDVQADLVFVNIVQSKFDHCFLEFIMPVIKSLCVVPPASKCFLCKQIMNMSVSFN